MNYPEFKKTMGDFTVFSLKDIQKQFPGFNRMNLYHWQEKGYIEKIRNKWYAFSDVESNEPNNFLIANKIYNPSYISLESALNYYGIIPEGDFIYTSVTTLKTNNIKTPKGTFRYSNIKPEFFFGYELIKYNGKTIKIADIEKTLCDYFYLNSNIHSIDTINGLRFNKDILRENIKVKKLNQYMTLYQYGKLEKGISILKKFLND
ncbi:MAG: hypothetical protein PWQ17_1692 [Anaerophaga sp.]|nr:hypothetical protein [Anaerophaga sp.]